MSVITIHAEDNLAAAVRLYADQLGKSMNFAVKELLSSALGLAKAPRRRHDFSEFCGILKKGDADEIRANMKAVDTVDAELWK
jgi:hypothetical protein